VMDFALKVKIARLVRLIAPVMIRRIALLEFVPGFAGTGSVRWVRTAPPVPLIVGLALGPVVFRMKRLVVTQFW